ncbi:MAG TPA: hypothetical protein VFH80_05390 [Solirubrobacteraceae bacterium]|nr:hypothetical protein [Solirubrobacteraceae bacterium]
MPSSHESQSSRGPRAPWFVRVLRAIDKVKPWGDPYATASQVYGDGSESSAYATELEDAFYRSMMLPNGTLKTTCAQRLTDVNRLVQQYLPDRRPVRIKDVAVSSGVSTLEWARELRESGIEAKMTATDLTIFALLVAFTDRLRVLFDSRGGVLQIDIAGYPAYPRLSGRVNRRLAGMPARLAGWFVAGELTKLTRSQAGQRGGFVRQLELVTPGVREAGIELREEDLTDLGESEERWDVIRAANVLNRSYFGADELRGMVDSLVASLEIGGLLAVCRTDLGGMNHGSVWRSRADGTLELLGRVGRGSEIEDLVSDRQNLSASAGDPQAGRSLPIG